MKVKELIQLLKELPDQEAVIDIASDEEGNSYGDIDTAVAESILKNGGSACYSLYPISSELPEERYLSSGFNSYKS